jgi:hypothetical protein
MTSRADNIIRIASPSWSATRPERVKLDYFQQDDAPREVGRGGGVVRVFVFCKAIGTFRRLLTGQKKSADAVRRGTVRAV